jgi:hypothetical protein
VFGVEGDALADYRTRRTAALEAVHQREEEARRKALDSAKWSMLAVKVMRPPNLHNHPLLSIYINSLVFLPWVFGHHQNLVRAYLLQPFI